MVIRFGLQAMLLNVVVKRFGVKKNDHPPRNQRDLAIASATILAFIA